MEWSDFYYDYYDWSESTLRSRISSLKDIGPGDEVVEVVLGLPTEKLKAQLVRKAIRYNVSFTHDDFMNLEGELPDEVYAVLAQHTGFDANNPTWDPDDHSWDYFNSDSYDWSDDVVLRMIGQLEAVGSAQEVSETISYMSDPACKEALYKKAIANGVQFNREQLEDMGRKPSKEELIRIRDELPDDLNWDVFYSENFSWSEKKILRAIEQLRDLGPADEVCETVCNLFDWDCQEALFQKAVAKGIKFTKEQLSNMGREDEDEFTLFDEDVLEESISEFEVTVDSSRVNIKNQKLEPRKGPGFFGTLFAILGAFAGGGSDKKDTGHCDGDCANCPPHYGYRYGRWYYGHGHQYSCQRGGNGGASGRCYHD